MSIDEPKTLLDPSNRVELLRGWMLHARKARERHTEAARQFEQRRVWIGGIAAVASATTGALTAGSSITGPPGLTAFFAILTLVSANVAALHSFLNYEGRAASHQAAATQYKAVIWSAEQLLTDDLHPDGGTAHDIDRLRERLDAVELAAPVVDHAIWGTIEGRFTNPIFVASVAGPGSAPDRDQGTGSA
jgi:hypothetical protein